MGGEPLFDGDPPDAIDIDLEDIVPPPTSNSLPELGEAETIDHRPPPKAYVHACDVWTLMKQEARQASEGWVWEGTTTGLFDRLDKGRALYTQVMTKLQEMGCVEQLRRGGGPQPSIWLVLKAPKLDDFYAAPSKVKTPKQARPGQVSANDNAQQLRDVNRRLTAVEDYLRQHDAPI